MTYATVMVASGAAISRMRVALEVAAELAERFEARRDRNRCVRSQSAAVLYIRATGRSSCWSRALAIDQAAPRRAGGRVSRGDARPCPRAGMALGGRACRRNTSSQQARAADLVVCGAARGPLTDPFAVADPADLVMQIGRPLLVVPARRRPGRSVERAGGVEGQSGSAARDRRRAAAAAPGRATSPSREIVEEDGNRDEALAGGGRRRRLAVAATASPRTGFVPDVGRQRRGAARPDRDRGRSRRDRRRRLRPFATSANGVLGRRHPVPGRAGHPLRAAGALSAVAMDRAALQRELPDRSTRADEPSPQAAVADASPSSDAARRRRRGPDAFMPRWRR